MREQRPQAFQEYSLGENGALLPSSPRLLGMPAESCDQRSTGQA